MSIVGQPDWFRITTGAELSIYRFYADGVISEDPADPIYIAVYDTDGILIKEANDLAYGYAYIDLSLSPNTDYIIKVFQPGGYRDTGEYLICVTQLVCDAGIDRETAMPLSIGQRYTAELDTEYYDWFICTF